MQTLTISQFIDLFDNYFMIKLNFFDKDGGNTYRYKTDNPYKLFPEEFEDICFDSVSAPWNDYICINFRFNDWKIDPNKIEGLIRIN